MLKKKIYLIVLAAALVSMITGCQSSLNPSGSKTITRETAVVENQLSNGILITYIPDGSRASAENGQGGESSGTANQMDAAARMIGEVTGGTLVSIGGDEDQPEDYGTVFLGIADQTPELPEAMLTYLEEQDFSGKTIIPFLVTDGGDLDSMVDTLYELEPEAEFLDGISIDTTGSADMQSEVNEWLSGLGYNH